MKNFRYLIIILLAVLILGSAFPILQNNNTATNLMSSGPARADFSQPSADSGITITSTPYVILELESGDITTRGNYWSNLMKSLGISNILLSTSELLSNPSLIEKAPAILIDGSLGSDDGNQVPSEVLDILNRADAPLLLTGRSIWLLHRLTDRDLPSLTAPVATSLTTIPEYAGTVFLTEPNALVIGSTLSTESGLSLPLFKIQTSMSRLVNLTGSSSSTIAPLRYDSYPLDMFLFAYENPRLLTPAGIALLENVIAFSHTLRESTTAEAITSTQTPQGELLAGGFRYMQSPSISSTYYAVHAAMSILTGSAWTNWSAEKTPIVRSILNELQIDYGSETGFMTSKLEGVVNCQSTAQALYLISTMELTSEFPVSKIVAYLSSRQSVNGDFENYITTTFHVTEALYVSGNLAAIDTETLESWLRGLVIDGTKTSDPNLWGAIGPNPTSTSAKTNYAAEYLLSLGFIGKAHPDPSKLTNWILSRTSNGDGSFKNSNGLDEELVTGTASALMCMDILGTLNLSNKTASLNWFSANQLVSGGFGMKSAASDLVAKTRETWRVATTLKILGATSTSIAENILDYLDFISTEIGFESMDFLPSLMWTSYLLEASRLTHASPLVDNQLAEDYIRCFETMTIYPYWENLTTTSAPEYLSGQYRTKSVWTQYFGVSSAAALGIQLNPAVVSDIVLYISQSQLPTGHYKPTSFTGTAHMQYSVAAIETLYLLGELNTITYRSSLESAVLSEYDSGTWNSAGWTLGPFSGSQEMIDFLSTRAALRLGLLTPTMASEIASTIKARIQYSDLMALSMDVATLALLQSLAFSVSVDVVNASAVLSALRSSHFIDGWYNATYEWQPIYTASVLKMVSILGLRSQLYDISGTTLTASSDAIVQLGSTLDMNVSITSTIDVHTVIVQAFDESILYRNVANSDTLAITIPTRSDSLGNWNISIIVSDWGFSRSFDMISIMVQGHLEGFLNLETPLVKMGDFINGTISWALHGGEDAGVSQVAVRLGDPPTYHQWTYQKPSPFDFSIPSTDFDAESYNLTAIITVQNCAPLILSHQVQIVEPNPTYIQATTEVQGQVGSTLSIDWSLRFHANDTIIPNQKVTLMIWNSSNDLVHTDQLISDITSSSFSWIPTTRGDYSFVLIFEGNNTLDDSQLSGNMDIFENTLISWSGTGLLDQYSSDSITVQLKTTSGEVLVGQDVHIILTSSSATTVLDTTLTTNSTGYASFIVSLSENGIYLLQATFADDGFLVGCSSTDSITAWSLSNLEVGGIDSEETLGEVNSIWASLTDSVGFPIDNQEVMIRIVLLPSTTVREQILTTNSSGLVTLLWAASPSGSYQILFQYNGSLSRSSASDINDFEVLVPVNLEISYSPSPQVGILGWIQVLATDHQSNPISGITVTVTVEALSGEIIYTNVSSTSSGIVVFSWLPTIRGINSITCNSGRHNWYQQAISMAYVDVLETPTLQIHTPEELIAPVNDTIEIKLQDNASNPIDGVQVHTVVMLNGEVLYDSNDITDVLGQITLSLTFSEPGLLIVHADLSSQGSILATSTTLNDTVAASTTLTIIIPGMPIEQGSTLGLLITLLDYSGSPLSGSEIEISVTWNNGTPLASYIRLTDKSGQCTLARTFNEIGDFLISARYNGYGINASASDSVVQRVFTTPNIQLLHDPSCIVSDSIIFQISLTDSLGNFISGCTFHLSVEQDGAIVFDVQAQSIKGFSQITWYPQAGGLAEITALHEVDNYYLSNSTTSSLSVLELVSGTIDISPSQIDLFSSATLTYTLNTTSPRDGINIHFEVLGMDLVPVWSMDVSTNASGIASVVYTANEAHGFLYVSAGPVSDEFLIGGDVQEQLIIMTDCNVLVSMIPYPPAVNSIINISIEVDDELGNAIDGLSTTVSVYNPYGQQIKLGAWTNSITIIVEDGLAIVQFTPTMVGLYTVTVTSSGSVSVHGFSISTHHTIYSLTQLQLSVSNQDLEVGQTLEVSAHLVDHNGNPMVGRNITLTLDGPGSSSIGPVVLITNSTGFAFWNVEIDDEGLWSLDAEFNGLGVYLPASASTDIDVKYGTIVELSLLTSEDIVARANNASFSILLEDTGGTPLEGFTVHYEVRHETLGMITQGNLIQSDIEPMNLTLSFEQMGRITLIVSFVGTSHYHASNAAIELWVFGTTRVVSDIPHTIDRANKSSFLIWIEDENSVSIPLAQLDSLITLDGPEGSIDLTGKLSWNTSAIEFSTANLPVGFYTLTVTIPSSTERVGCVEVLEFSITSTILIELDTSSLPGIISESHTLTFFLRDSLNELVANADVWISLYDPLGREIYGSALSTKTLVISSVLGTAVSWVPTLVGEYHVLLDFEGDAFYSQSTSNISVLVRYESFIALEAPDVLDFGEPLPVSVKLTGVLGGLSGKSISIVVSMDGTSEYQGTLVTDRRGIVSYNIIGLLAGTHVISVTFFGSNTQAPRSCNITMDISPVVVINADDEQGLYVGHNCTVILFVSVLGTSGNWTGMIEATLVTPNNVELDDWSWEIGSHSEIHIIFRPESVGTYSLNITVFGLPIIVQQTCPLSIAIVRESLKLTLDAGSTPLLGGFGILSVVGVVMRKKMKKVVGSLPGEWSE